MTTKKKKKVISRKLKSAAMRFLDRVVGDELTFSHLLRSLRETEETSQSEFAKLLGISRQNLCDLEKGRKGVSAERAASFARTLGYPEEVFVALALQEEVDRGGLKLKVSVQAA